MLIFIVFSLFSFIKISSPISQPPRRHRKSDRSLAINYSNLSDRPQKNP
ncbi:MAG: hypothetical protein F6K35_43515 [Okeania sp. SIO2H7]|nr:hypothetical protein [Okeania sp. SIO2H7]